MDYGVLNPADPTATLPFWTTVKARQRRGGRKEPAAASGGGGGGAARLPNQDLVGNLLQPMDVVVYRRQQLCVVTESDRNEGLRLVVLREAGLGQWVRARRLGGAPVQGAEVVKVFPSPLLRVTL